MDIKTEAHEYAVKVLGSEIAKIEEAYIKGYEAGKKDGGGEPVFKEGDIEWVDMSLPSGTLWSKPLDDEDLLLSLPYNKAKLMDIPTVDDFEELTRETRQSLSKDTLSFLSKDGVEYEVYRNTYWLKGEVNDKSEAPCVNFDCGNIFWSTGYSFTGYSKNIILVKHKDNN